MEQPIQAVRFEVVQSLRPSDASPLRVRLAGGPPIWDAARLVAGDDAPVVLTGAWAGARAIVASQPLRTASVDEDPFALLDEQPLIDGSGDLIVGGGWLGYLGFQLSRRLERIGAPPPDAEALPDAVLAFYDHVLVLDGDGPGGSRRCGPPRAPRR